ncbi:unnamed protein product, partial [Durusdinium trenchii]
VNALFELMEARLSATRTVHSGQNGDAVGAKTLESLFTQKDVMKAHSLEAESSVLEVIE